MNRRLATFLIIIGCLTASAAPIAHDELRLVGTVARLGDTAMDVKARSGKTYTVRLNKETVVVRDGERVELSALGVGQGVVVDVYGDTLEDSLARRIQIVAATAGSR